MKLRDTEVSIPWAKQIPPSLVCRPENLYVTSANCSPAAAAVLQYMMRILKHSGGGAVRRRQCGSGVEGGAGLHFPSSERSKQVQTSCTPLTLAFAVTEHCSKCPRLMLSNAVLLFKFL